MDIVGLLAAQHASSGVDGEGVHLKGDGDGFEVAVDEKVGAQRMLLGSHDERFDVVLVNGMQCRKSGSFERLRGRQELRHELGYYTLR